MGAGIGGCTTTGAGAVTTGTGAVKTGTGSGIPKLIPKRTPAFTVVIPRAARARIAIVFFIISICWTRWVSKASLQMDYRFVSLTGGKPAECGRALVLLVNRPFRAGAFGE